MSKEEELKKFVESVAKYHRGCEDGWYACPQSPDYFKRGDTDEDKNCYCWAGDAQDLLKKLYGNF